jgi:hypothetical protein
VRRHEPNPPPRRDPRRRCGGIFAADGADEEGTLERLKALRRDLVDPKIAEHNGRIVRPPATACWSSLPASSMPCVRCAVAVQQAIPERNAGVAADSRIAPDGLLRHVVCLGERADKAAIEVRRSRSHAG